MRFFRLFAAVPVSSVAAFSFNAYDLGFQGIYPRQHFHSVDFEPPATKITQWDPQCDSGSLFLTPRGPWVTGAARGPIITDSKGNLIWMDNGKFEQAMNFNVQQYKGEDYLTFWTKSTKHKKHKKSKKHKDSKHAKGSKHSKHSKDKDKDKDEDKDTKKSKKHKKSKKSYVMLNSAYEVAYRITPHGKKLKGDSHEFRVTPQGTALITIYEKRQTDCTDLKLGKSCWIQDGLFQELDIETGKLIFEWRATDHIRMTDVYTTPNMKDGHGTSKQDAFDFFHINSVDKTESGDYVISARYMKAVVCVSGMTGEILWSLGGKNNDFRDLNSATDFAWQHHVTWLGNNTLSLFDNHANNVFHSPSSHSKGMIIHLDMEKMTASLRGKYHHPDKILNVSQGSVQIVNETGNVLVGFGNSPTYVEYAPNGKVLCAAHFAPHIAFEIIDFGLVKSYRIFKHHSWVGRPKTVPDVAVKGNKAYVSWNGATEVKGWRLETAPAQEAETEEFVSVQEAERDGFETSFTLKKRHKFVRIAALDASNEVLAFSATVSTASPVSGRSWSSVFLIFLVMALIFVFASYIFRHDERFPRLRRPHLSKRLSDIKVRGYAVIKYKRGSQQYDAELSPLLMPDDERDIEA
ncbi:hypothetical protein H2200_010132 [Cladophialophora chaetospira]|uniref:Arylsulfotransferase n=1 Tax=Cladophialophora chaetospira TaxID=386627 RepID=A0AA38X2A5_9EURO|nr:hypothetical protein H2200_010132 [Cladophialophora chaetospira]